MTLERSISRLHYRLASVRMVSEVHVFRLIEPEFGKSVDFCLRKAFQQCGGELHPTKAEAEQMEGLEGCGNFEPSIQLSRTQVQSDLS